MTIKRTVFVLLLASSATGIKLKEGAKLRGIHDAYLGVPTEEAAVGNANLKNGNTDVAKGIQGLRAAYIQEANQAIKEANEFLDLTKNNSTENLPVEKIKSFVKASIQRKDDQKDKDIKSLSKVDDGSKQAAMGLFEVRDASKQEQPMKPRSQFGINPARMKRFKEQNYAASLGGGGCIATMVQTPFINTLNYATGGDQFFSVQSGTSGGVWTMLADALLGDGGAADTNANSPQNKMFNQFLGGGNRNNCTLLDPSIGTLPPEKRTAAMLSCLGCQNLDYNQCNMFMQTWTSPQKIAVFDSAAGCVEDAASRARVATIPALCNAYSMKSGGTRTCGLMNLNHGLVSAVLPPRRTSPVEVDIDFLGLKGASSTAEELNKPRAAEPVYQMKYDVSSSYISMSTSHRNQFPDDLDFLNQSVGKANGQYFKMSEWEKAMRESNDIDVDYYAQGSKLPLHTLQNMATLTSDMPTSFFLQTLWILSSGLCRTQHGSDLSLKGIMGEAMNGMVDLWMQKEHSEENRKVLSKLMSSWPKVFTVPLQNSWQSLWSDSGNPAQNSMNKLKPTQGKQMLHCLDQNVTEWFSPDKSQDFWQWLGSPDGTGHHHARHGLPEGQKAFQSSYAPCFFEDESLTLMSLRTMLQPYGYFFPEGSMFGNSITGDAGNTDSLGLGTLAYTLLGNGNGKKLTKKYPGKPWHMVLLTAREISEQGDTHYFSHDAPIYSQLGRVVNRLQFALNADCSRTHKYVRNVNQIFYDNGLWKELEGEKRAFTDKTVRTVPNQRFGIPGGEALQFSLRQISSHTDDRWFDHFKDELPASYQNGLDSHNFPEFVASDGQGAPRRAINMAFGFPDPFDAWAVQHKSQLNALNFMCNMLMDDCAPAFENPLGFINEVRDHYVADKKTMWR